MMSGSETCSGQIDLPRPALEIEIDRSPVWEDLNQIDQLGCTCDQCTDTEHSPSHRPGAVQRNPRQIPTEERDETLITIQRAQNRLFRDHVEPI